MSMNERQEKISGIIINYLRRNPDAGDTLEGIVKWWLVFESIESSMDDVVDVLETLIRKKAISMYSIADGTTFYKVNKQAEL
jgi:hypothetical protein